MRWDYYRLKDPSSHDLERAGKHGWELVAVYMEENHERLHREPRQWPIYVFKKPMSDVKCAIEDVAAAAQRDSCEEKHGR